MVQVGLQPPEGRCDGEQSTHGPLGGPGSHTYSSSFSSPFLSAGPILDTSAFPLGTVEPNTQKNINSRLQQQQQTTIQRRDPTGNSDKVPGNRVSTHGLACSKGTASGPYPRSYPSGPYPAVPLPSGLPSGSLSPAVPTSGATQRSYRRSLPAVPTHGRYPAVLPAVPTHGPYPPRGRYPAVANHAAVPTQRPYPAVPTSGRYQQLLPSGPYPVVLPSSRYTSGPYPVVAGVSLPSGPYPAV
ncbi:MAPK-interacting and spindle-stabilizing protein-like [Salvelinus sp. IW2-2015]|uniref:MAPK-interacting and spindle-stabilizing protein-like n=1 Tax=Salvelinus sp. IW2-2015 TaxID=2691554 RepID=UPI000CEB1563|nr:MAPK-interacting and spindle-stabilizing protein-like [Salvelinus alpinus]